MRPYDFPEAPTGKTDQPCLVVSNGSIVELYNKVHDTSKHRKNVNKAVKTWFTQTAKEAGWSQVKWYLEYDAHRGLAALLVYKHTEDSSDERK